MKFIYTVVSAFALFVTISQAAATSESKKCVLRCDHCELEGNKNMNEGQCKVGPCMEKEITGPCVYKNHRCQFENQEKLRECREKSGLKLSENTQCVRRCDQCVPANNKNMNEGQCKVGPCMEEEITGPCVFKNQRCQFENQEKLRECKKEHK